MQFRQDINGLRAVAVAAVVLYHFGVPGISGGFVGVDVFFVISGFLLTSIAHPRIQEGRFSAIRFLVNRLRRTFPALAALALACVVWSGFTYLPTDYLRLARNATSALLFRSNYAFLSDAGGYFAPDAHRNLLLHTWSLAVEMQFYIGFALLGRLLWTRGGPRRRAIGWAVFAALFAASLAWCVRQTAHDPSSAFYLPWGRAWEFMAGAVIAIATASRTRLINDACALAGAALLLVAILGFTPNDPYPGWRALVPVLGTALIIFAGDGCLQRVLSSRPLQFVGDISYSVYLWHWPILVAFREHAGTEPGPTQRLWLLAASLAAGWVSYRLIEQPTRRLARTAAIVGLAACSIASGFAFSAILRHTDGWIERLPPYLEAAARATTSLNPRSTQCMRDVDGGPLAALNGRDFCALGTHPASAAPVMMLWGDSFADMFQPVVDRASDRLGAPGIVATQGGCPPWRGKVFTGSGAEVFSGCERYANFAFDTFMKTPSIRLVVIASDWQRYEAAHEGRVLADIAEELRRRGGRMVLIGLVSNPRGDVPHEWARSQTEAGHELLERGVPRSGEADIVAHAQAIESRAVAPGNVTVIQPFDSLCDARICRTVANGRALYKDTDHLSMDGVEIVAPALTKAIMESYRSITARAP